MNTHGKLLACGLAGSAAVAVSACGSSAPKEPSAADLQSSMQAAVRSASSVHLDGQTTESTGSVKVNIGVHRTGELSGTVTQNGANVDVLKVSNKAYVKLTPQFLKQFNAPPSACSLVCGKWVQLRPSQASQTNQLSMQNVAAHVASTKLSSYKEVGSTTVNGKQAWALRAPNGAEIDVSSQGTPYPLRSTQGNGHGVIHYSQWNAVPHPAAPPANQVVNLSGLH